MLTNEYLFRNSRIRSRTCAFVTRGSNWISDSQVTWKSHKVAALRKRAFRRSSKENTRSDANGNFSQTLISCVSGSWFVFLGLGFFCFGFVLWGLCVISFFRRSPNFCNFQKMTASMDVQNITFSNSRFFSKKKKIINLAKKSFWRYNFSSKQKKILDSCVTSFPIQLFFRGSPKKKKMTAPNHYVSQYFSQCQKHHCFRNRYVFQ